MSAKTTGGEVPSGAPSSASRSVPPDAGAQCGRARRARARTRRAAPRRGPSPRRDPTPPSRSIASAGATMRRTSSTKTSAPVDPPKTLGSPASRPGGSRLDDEPALAHLQHVREHPLGVRAQRRPHLVLTEVALRDERRAGVTAERRELRAQSAHGLAREVAARPEEREQRLVLDARRRGHDVALAKDEPALDGAVDEAERAAGPRRDRARRDAHRLAGADDGRERAARRRPPGAAGARDATSPGARCARRPRGAAARSARSRRSEPVVETPPPVEPACVPPPCVCGGAGGSGRPVVGGRAPARRTGVAPLPVVERSGRPRRARCLAFARARAAVPGSCAAGGATTSSSSSSASIGSSSDARSSAGSTASISSSGDGSIDSVSARTWTRCSASARSCCSSALTGGASPTDPAKRGRARGGGRLRGAPRRSRRDRRRRRRASRASRGARACSRAAARATRRARRASARRASVGGMRGHERRRARPARERLDLPHERRDVDRAHEETAPLVRERLFGARDGAARARDEDHVDVVGVRAARASG